MAVNGCIDETINFCPYCGEAEVRLVDDYGTEIDDTLDDDDNPMRID
jgi:hypothetical protein